MAKAARKQTGQKAGAARPAKRGGKKKTTRKAPAKRGKKAAKKKAAPKAARKRAPAKGTKRKAATRRRPSSTADTRSPVDAPPPAFRQLLRPSAPLAKLIGDEPRTRTRLLRELWIHIKRSGMQSTRDRTFFVPVKGVQKLFPEKREYSKLEVAAGLEGHVERL